VLSLRTGIYTASEPEIHFVPGPAGRYLLEPMELEELNRRIPLTGTFEGLIGTVYDAYEPGRLDGHVEVRENMLSRYGTAPLGLYATLAEGAASVGTAAEAIERGMTASGMSNDTTMTAAIAVGRVDFHARRQYDSPDLAVWDVEFTADHRVVALSTVRIAIRPRRPS
jgi:acyl-coenzyme A thioesterase PaaI-like protein